MNAREVMQALLDGQTVESVYGKFKLEPNGEILHFYVNGEEWDVAHMIFNDIRAEFKIVEEYPLTFKEAMQEMLKGNTVTNEVNYRNHYFLDDDDGCLICIDDGIGCHADITSEENTAKWKVVE